MFYHGAFFDVGWFTGPALPYIGFVVAVVLLTLLVSPAADTNDPDAAVLVELDAPVRFEFGDEPEDLRKAA